MRIVKGQATGVLRTEVSQLMGQCQRCQRQINKFSTFALDGMSGVSVTAAEQRMHMQVSIVTSHLGFFQALMQADNAGIRLVSALPTTSAGVLDTTVAQHRIDKAQTQITALEKRMQQEVERARAANELAMTLAASSGMPVTLVDIDGVRSLYLSLIKVQKSIVTHNERILVEARRFEREYAQVFKAVDGTLLTQSTATSQSFVDTGAWGDTTWVGRMRMDNASHRTGSPEVLSVYQRFINGDLKYHAAAASGEQVVESTVAGIPVRTKLDGELFDVTAYAKPYGKSGLSDQQKDQSAAIGFETGVKGSVAHGTVQSDIGFVQFTTKGAVASGEVAGSLGLSLLSDGKPNPSVEAKVKAKGTALSLESQERLGIEDFNQHTRVKGALGVAEAKAGIHVGSDGIEFAAGSEAYVATGEIASGITLLGVRFEATREVKVGGEGAVAAAKVTPTAVEGQLGVGFGVGAGIHVKVDWSGFPKAIERFNDTAESVAAWWTQIVCGPTPQVA